MTVTTATFSARDRVNMFLIPTAILAFSFGLSTTYFMYLKKTHFTPAAYAAFATAAGVAAIARTLLKCWSIERARREIHIVHSEENLKRFALSGLLFYLCLRFALYLASGILATTLAIRATWAPPETRVLSVQTTEQCITKGRPCLTCGNSIMVTLTPIGPASLCVDHLTPRPTRRDEVAVRGYFGEHSAYVSEVERFKSGQ